ncbi:MAG: SMC-Scp complex subunit ScpB [Patescibacteria group bacterium]
MSEQVSAAVEALLFVAGKPMSVNQIAKTLSLKQAEVDDALKELHDRYEQSQSGLQLVFTEKNVQLYAAAKQHEAVESYIEQEEHSELTKPQLETLAIIAYRGPVIKEELEYIRGVNCTIILRNLMLRGLVTEQQTQDGLLYEVSGDFLAHLGIAAVEELPEYSSLHEHERLADVMEEKEEVTTS